MTREDLKRYKHTQKWVLARQEYLQDYYERVYNITSTIQRIKVQDNSGVVDRMAESLVKVLDNLADLFELVGAESDKLKAIAEKISRLDYPYRNIVEMYYIQGMRMVNIADELGYSEKHCHKLNSMALNMFDEL